MRNDILMGPGSSAAIADVVQRCTGRAHIRAAVVVGSGFSGRLWSAQVCRATESLRPLWITHTGDATPHGVATLARRLAEQRVDVVVAIGGGAVMDAAKAASRLAGASDVDADGVVAACTGAVTPPPSRARVVAVPTTPGTGAEVTPFATVWDTAGHRKLSLSGPTVAPAAAILDPDLLRGLPAHHVAGSLLDTLCQGAEAAWSVRATERSTSLGLAAVALVGPLLSRLRPDDLTTSDRITLQLAGHLSGCAIAAAPTSSCHAISYPLTLRAGLAHGHACGVSFGRLLRFNAETTEADCVDPRGPVRAREVVERIVSALGATDVDDADHRVEAFLRRTGLDPLDAVPLDRDQLARDALAYPRIADNPRRLTAAGLAHLLGPRPGAEDPCR